MGIISYPVILFLTACIWQFASQGEVRFIDNLGVSIIAMLLLALWEWSKKPARWKKDEPS